MTTSMYEPIHPSAAPEILRLRDRLSLIEEDNRQLRAMIGADHDRLKIDRAKRAYGLSERCARLLLSLATGSARTTDVLMRAYADLDEGSPSTNTLKVQVYRLRRLMMSHQIYIKTDWGVGYSMDAGARERVIAVVEASAQ